MGAVETLRGVAAALSPNDWDRDAVGLPVLDPRCQLIYQPHRCREKEKDSPEAVLIAAARRDLARRLAVAAGGEASPEPAGDGCSGCRAAPPPLGLSEAQNPQTAPRRYGDKGLSANGARQIQRSAAVLQDRLGMLSFWTVTLPDETIRELVQRDLWPQFQTRIRDLLGRALQQRGLSPLVIGVVELHPSRSMRERLPLPHLHVVFQGSRRRWGGWVLEPEDLDRIIRNAVRYCGLPAPDTRAAGNVQPVKRNCGAYLAKYMTKSRQSLWLAKVPGNLPRVWWFWTAPLRALVLALVVWVSWSFVSWCHRLPDVALESLQIDRRRLELADPRAPATWVLSWRSAAQLACTVEVWGGTSEIPAPPNWQ